MKKTALQQAIEKLEARKYNAQDTTKFERAYNEAIEDAIAELKFLLPTEKEREKQIAQEAWAACLDYVTTPGLPNFEQYFTNTYGN